MLRKFRPVGVAVEIGILDHGDGLAAAGDPRGEERIDVIDLGEVGRRHEVAFAAAAAGRIGRVRAVEPVRPEIIERDHARHDRLQRRRDRRIVHVGDMLGAAHGEPVEGRVECLGDLPGRAGEIDQHAARIDFIHREAMRGEPARYRRDVGRGGAEAPAELGGAQPLVEIGRGGVVQ